MRRYVRVPLRVTLRKAASDTSLDRCACLDGPDVEGQPRMDNDVWEVIGPRIARANG